MKKQMQNRLAALVFTISFFSILTFQPLTARAQNTAFIYQDFVNQGLPTDLTEGVHKIGAGDFTFTFRLATGETGSNYIGEPITNKVIITAGQFSTPLDFGNLFDGTPRWVEVARKVGKQFITLTPRQLLRSAPYALYAYTAGTIAATNIAINSLTLPDPATIFSGTGAVLYSDGSTGNFFAGQGSGNLTDGSGNNNTADGYQALYTNGSVNVSGANDQYSPDVGNNNTANGYQALYNNGSANISGANIQQVVTVGNNNTANGYQALYNNGKANISNANIQQPVTAGNDNTAFGYQALLNNGVLSDHGRNIQSSITVGNNNIALGYQAGTNIISGNNNIDIGASGPGDESSIIRIGDTNVQTATYLAGTVYANGVALSSDRNAKEQFAPINAQAVLNKVAMLPITQWVFKNDKSTQHIGPMAQDFKAAFNVGTDDKHIAVVDEGGVALAAIQGLNQKLNEQSAQMKEKDAEIQDLKQSLAELKNMIETMSGRAPNGSGR